MDGIIPERAFGFEFHGPGSGRRIVENGWDCAEPDCTASPDILVVYYEPCRGAIGYRSIHAGYCPRHADAMRSRIAETECGSRG